MEKTILKNVVFIIFYYIIILRHYVFAYYLYIGIIYHGYGYSTRPRTMRICYIIMFSAMILTRVVWKFHVPYFFPVCCSHNIILRDEDLCVFVICDLYTYNWNRIIACGIVGQTRSNPTRTDTNYYYYYRYQTPM